MSKKSLLVIAGLVLLTACSDAATAPSTIPSGQQRQGPRHECPSSGSGSPTRPPTGQVTTQEQQCTPME